MDIESIVRKYAGDIRLFGDVMRAALTELAAGYENRIIALNREVVEANERIRQLEDERVPEWRQQKPTEPGAYWLKGNIFNAPDAVSLVRVEWFDGELSIVAGDDPEDHHAWLSDWRDDFYWAGPLAAAPQPKKEPRHE